MNSAANRAIRREGAFGVVLGGVFVVEKRPQVAFTFFETRFFFLAPDSRRRRRSISRRPPSVRPETKPFPIAALASAVLKMVSKSISMARAPFGFQVEGSREISSSRSKKSFRGIRSVRAPPPRLDLFEIREESIRLGAADVPQRSLAIQPLEYLA